MQKKIVGLTLSALVEVKSSFHCEVIGPQSIYIPQESLLKFIRKEVVVQWLLCPIPFLLPMELETWYIASSRPSQLSHIIWLGTALVVISQILSVRSSTVKKGKGVCFAKVSNLYEWLSKLLKQTSTIPKDRSQWSLMPQKTPFPSFFSHWSWPDTWKIERPHLFLNRKQGNKAQQHKAMEAQFSDTNLDLFDWNGCLKKAC